MRLPIYLDYMATTPVDPQVATIMQDCLTLDGIFGNPGSQHIYGQQALEVVENARQQVAELVNTSSENIIWTSGATEADNLAIKGAALFYQRQGKHIITCQTEHKAVLDTCMFLERKGFVITFLKPKADGLIDPVELEKNLRPDTILVSIMHVNNEIGVIQDIAEIGKLTRKRGILFHVDAAQSIGKIPIDLATLPVDLMSFSAHKIYGPKGVGALYIRPEPRIHLEPLIHGGEQEKNLRSGTLATHQIAGMGKALQIAKEEMHNDHKKITLLHKKLWDGIKVLGDIYINGSTEKRVPHNLNISFGGIEGETLIAALKDVAVSAAAACCNITFEPSYVLKAIGVKNDLALNSIRFSLGRFTTEEEIDYASKHICEVVTKLRK